jgi:hypothetical protein
VTSRRRPQGTHQDVSARALSAMADAARRARAADGGVAELQTSSQLPDPHPDPAGHRGEEREPASTSRRNPDRPSPRLGPSATPPSLPAVPPSTQGIPTSTFDALAEEQAGGAFEHASIGPVPSGSSTERPAPGAPPVTSGYGSRPSNDRDRLLRRAVAVVSVALVAVVAALVGSGLAGGRTTALPSGAYRPTARASRPSSTVPTTSTTVPSAAPTTPTTRWTLWHRPPLRPPLSRLLS